MPTGKPVMFSQQPNPDTVRFSIFLRRSLILLAAFTVIAQPVSGDDTAELPPLVRCFALPDKPPAPFPVGAEKRFSPLPGETISFLGGSNTFDQQRFPFLETLLSLAYPEERLKFRNLAWQGDTVLFQHRPLYYYTEAKDTQPGSLPDQRQKIEPGILFITFGKMESLDGPESLGDFVTAYRSLLDELKSRSQRIVIVAPTPFFSSGPAAALRELRNESLSQFAAALRALAAERRLLYVDTFTPLLNAVAAPLTTDGIHLNEAGHRRVAEIVAVQLHFPVDPAAVLDAPGLQPLAESILTKNRLWQQYYRPTNWAFLYGDRQHVPASRDHRDKNARWFIDEVETLPRLIAETEAGIHRYARTVEIQPRR